LGIVGTGLLDQPRTRLAKWPIGLAREPLEAKAFYMTVVVATLAGIAISFSPLDPMSALSLVR
jgi:hypothetical protein